MKTLHLTNAWHPTSGGIATFYRCLMEAAERHQRLIRVVKPSDRSRVEEVNRYARIYHVRAPRAPFDGRYRILLPHRLLVPHSVVWRILREEQPDLLEVNDKYTFTYLAATLRRGWIPGIRFRPVVVGLSCERLDDNVRAYLTSASVGRILAQLYMKWLYFPFFDQHITVSPYTALELERAARGHEVRRSVWVQPMGVDEVMFHPGRRTASIRKRLLRECRLSDGARLLLYAGRLAREKNLPLLVRMMERLISTGEDVYHFLLAGDGVLRASLEQDCQKRLPGRFTFLGHIGCREQLADLLANVDAFVHPNPHEPYGIAPLEAMASGTPLIAPLSGGVTAYANEANSWPVPPEPDAFAGAVREVFADAQLRGAKTRLARQTAVASSWAKVTENYFSLYDEIYALQKGITQQPRFVPAFHSTPGNWLGMEV